MTSTVDPLSGLLSSLTQAVQSTASAIPSDHDALLPSQQGISLLDVKNDLLLSYIQNLVFLILLKLRDNSGSQSESATLGKEVCEKLVELRVYIERGTRPLEGRLKYQIDKVLRASEDAKRKTAQGLNGVHKNKTIKHKTGNSDFLQTDEASSDSGADSGSEIDATINPDDLAYAPNAAQLLKKQTLPQATNATKSAKISSSEVYKPPRITPTAMPTPVSTRPATSQRQRKSHLLNEFLDEEFSNTPQAQPSIGSNNTILQNGRSGMSTRDREKQRERTEYEERNFVRLPNESKAERRKAKSRAEREGQREVFGGEDWTGLGGMGDRVSRVVSRSGNDEDRSMLKRREKRRREMDTTDGPRQDGSGIGDAFEKKRRIMEGRAEKKMRKKR